MALDLRQHENVVYPIPYEEAASPPLVITNQRVVRRQPRAPGPEELPTSRIDFVGRQETRPLSGLGVVLAILALPLLVIGGYLIVSVWGMEMAPPLDTAKELTQPILSKLPGLKPSTNAGGPAPEVAAEVAAEVEAEAPEPASDGEDGAPSDGAREVLLARAGGAALLLLGLVLGVVGVRLSRRRAYFVIVRAQGSVWRIDVPDPGQQSQIMVTLQAVAGR